MDDLARDFHKEVLADLRALAVDENTPGQPITAAQRLITGIGATVITDLNRLARAQERIADAQEGIWRAAEETNRIIAGKGKA